MASEKVLYRKQGQVAYITLNRPEVKNAIDL
jgi:enoyl-CoA hydratase/carnithine racemase